MLIKQAVFITSNTDVEKCPREPLPEYAFIGRSNVGKSSLINMLVNNKHLAKTSSTPGKTQLINHFKIDNSWFLVDLPGYGYARVSKTKRQQFQKFITRYFEKRKQLVSAFVLIDIRHEPQAIDIAFIRWLGENLIPFSLVFTKADKLKVEELNNRVISYQKHLVDNGWEELPPHFITSGTKGIGREELITYITSLNSQMNNR